MEPLFTVGHSTHPIEEFLRMLEPNGVVRVIDVRAFPRSRTNPQYNEDALPRVLAPRGIAYEHIASLGGKRPRSKDVPEATNAFWDNASFHNYADYAMGADFREGLAALLDRGARERVAFMCAEAVWWRCHRRIVADYALAAGRDVWHIMGPEALEPARMTPAARPGPGGSLVYPFTLS
ncbi:MAG TPA: DUF488 domain-containing protein [Usitatibacter sp.]|jgi:uncharacterized protein (DUF488 family)|nr:DUF488 domain-containing protein [Usitatibacter sp.]